jgi:hypothetical protein
VLAVICLGLFLTVHSSVQTAGQKTGPGNWEHMALTHRVAPNVTDATLARQIVEIGEKGWELVDVDSVNRDGTTVEMVYFFKRPK